MSAIDRPALTPWNRTRIRSFITSPRCAALRIPRRRRGPPTTPVAPEPSSAPIRMRAAVARPESAFARFMTRVHAHPRARLLEFLLWGSTGGLVLALGLWMWKIQRWEVPGLLVVIVGACLVGWGLLPPKKTHPKPPPPGRRRREIAEARKTKRSH